MLKAYYRSSLVALGVGVAAFAASVLLMRVCGLSADLVFAPGLVVRNVLNALGADLPRRTAVATTLLAWCLVADALLLVVRRPWRESASAKS
jgi:hypothetical protein